MSLLPRTLLWRTFLLMSLVIMLSMLAWFSIYSSYETEPRARQLSQLAASVVNLTRAALVSAQPERRRDLLLELSDREGIVVYPAEPADQTDPLESSVLMARVAEELRRRLGADTRLAASVNDLEGFWISFTIDGDRYWVALPSERLKRLFPWQWLGWGAAALALSLAAAYLTVSRVARPLNQLADAATALGRGTDPPPLAESGALEVATVAQAFNRMAADLHELDADRALILAGISHDLRTPLARLRLAVEMIGTDEATRDELCEDVDEIDQIIGQFLDFARAAGGEATQALQVDALLAELAEGYRRRGAMVSLVAGAGLSLEARPKALRRLLTNLIENALRHGGGEVELASRAAGDALLLEVADRGPGIAPDQVERLKRPFTRLDESRSGARGAGLGLAIVERIARSHAAKFDLLPRPGGGTLALVQLPLPKGAATA